MIERLSPTLALSLLLASAACAPTSTDDDVRSRMHTPPVVEVEDTPPASGSGGSNADVPPVIEPDIPDEPQEPDQPPEVDEHGWRLVWADEFDGATIDPAKWTHEQNCWGGGNNELQCYVADSKNSFVQDGHLTIVARADSPTGSVGGPGGDQTVVTMPYSSARLITRGKAAFRYGRFEARIRLPFGQGLWPAFWMLPEDDVYGGWAASGEIDIMEAVNLSPSANYVHGTLHYGGSWPQNAHTGQAYQPPAFAGDTFYTYAVVWEEGAIHWFVDDVHFLTQTSWHTEGHAFPAPFDQDFFLILNVAVGGNWPGSPNGDTSFPQEMVVDFVRAYECSHDPVTGHGCTP